MDTNIWEQLLEDQLVEDVAVHINKSRRDCRDPEWNRLEEQ